MTYHVPDRRTLDRSFPAQLSTSYIRGVAYHRVYANASEVFPDTAAEARMIRDCHNEARVNKRFAMSRRETSIGTEPTWTDSWLTADEARAARGNESDVVNGTPVTRREARILRERAL